MLAPKSCFHGAGAFLRSLNTKDVYYETFSLLGWRKKQLLNEIHNKLPHEVFDGTIKRYVETFAGRGSVYCQMYNCFPDLVFYISDANHHLMNAYNHLKHEKAKIMIALNKIENDYNSLHSELESRSFYYKCRDDFNYSNRIGTIKRTALFIFLNKTCYCGVFRVKKDASFNGCFNKKLCVNLVDRDNFKEFSELRSSTKFNAMDYKKTLRFVTPDTLVFLDPPYRPLPRTSSFTAYQARGFDDSDQKELAEYCREVDSIGAKFILCNSDPHNTDSGDDFFENLYDGFNIKRVMAKRMINRNGSDRKAISELMITNYDQRQAAYGHAA